MANYIKVTPELIALRDAMSSGLCNLDVEDAKEYLIRNIAWVEGMLATGTVAEALVQIEKKFGFGLTEEETIARNLEAAQHYGMTYAEYMALPTS